MARHLPRLSLIRLRQTPILAQLELEEALFRTEKQRNWFIFNEDIDQKSIVMGIGGKPERLLDVERVKRDQIQVIKRYSGGGTVIVDHNTLFTTFICNQPSLPQVKPFPREIMAWSAGFFGPLFDRLATPKALKETPFALREDDYVFGHHKFAGNAQSISKNRWVHHTSFLWTFCGENMQKYLLQPAKQPKYRQQRRHQDFLCPMDEKLAIDKHEFAQQLELELAQHFEIDQTFHSVQQVLQECKLLEAPHRQSTRIVEL